MIPAYERRILIEPNVSMEKESFQIQLLVFNKQMPFVFIMLLAKGFHSKKKGKYIPSVNWGQSRQ